jgi:putative transposase
MPRRARIDAPGALHHIIIRGIERKPIFKDERDYENFLRRLTVVLSETSTPCYAWALLTNHIHLLLRTGLSPITTVMRRLLTGYAQQFNRRHNRHGHLFQNRYKSILCEEDPYLLELVRYIHLNPLRAGHVETFKELATYAKTGHPVLLGKIKREWQDTDFVLGLFGKTIDAARSSYSAFVREGATQGRRPDLVGGGLLRSIGGWSALRMNRSRGDRLMGDERILGNSKFVERVIEKANEEYERKTLVQLRGPGLPELIESVADFFGIDEGIVRSASKRRDVSRARSILCHIAVNRFMLSCVEVAKELNLSPSTVSKSTIRGQSDTLVSQIEEQLVHRPVKKRRQ